MMSIVVSLACALFIAYLICAIVFLGVIPPSISDTFYLYEEKKKGLGYVFTIWMLTEAFLMIMPMVELGDGEWWQFVGFLCPALISFCGSAPTFMDGGLAKRVHFFGAFGSAITGLIWCAMMDIAMLGTFVLIFTTLTIFASVATETDRECKTFWLELISFGTIAFCLLFNVI